jgi:FtsZ-binding cell division protein ZapB
VAALQSVKPEEWPVGQRIKCLRCGREGKAGISAFRAKGREYVYLVVNHADGRKCVIARADKAVLQAVKPVLQSVKPEEVEKLREENERLKAEVARLEEENARLREENRQLRETIAAVYNARIVQAGPYERMCVRRVAWRESKLPPEVRETGWSILKALAGERSVDWVAVRMDAFEQLRGFLA